MVILYERLNDYVVEVNHYPFHRRELIDAAKGIIRVYGKDGDKEKINHVIYPKSIYTREYIETDILPKYENCPLCNIGTEIITISKIDTIKNFLPVKNNKKGIGIGLTIGLLTAIPILFLFIRKKLTKSET